LFEVEQAAHGDDSGSLSNQFRTGDAGVECDEFRAVAFC
jgi:hypothetical protein